MELLEQHFDTAFSAPEGIQKLRELILTLAMQGKLVPQSPSDKPANTLLKDIEAEKKRLAKEGKIKAPKPQSEIGIEELPGALPDGWVWVRNGFLFGLRKGKVPKDLSESAGSIPYLDIEALDRGNVRRYTEDAKAPQSTDKDILVVCDGSRSGLILEGKNGAIGSTLSVIETPLFIQPFVKLIFRQGYQRMNSSMKGAAIPHLDSKNLLLDVIGLPPLAEQKRILEKVDQLLARCNALETLRHSREGKRLAIHAAALSQLLDTAGNGSPDDAWAFITQHFSDLYAVKENVAELRKAILQLAVMGKLVPQDPNDPPASQLLKEIEAEKKRLVKEGKIKAPKPLPEIKPEDELPFVLPETWLWVRIEDIAEAIDYGTSQKTGGDSSLVPVYRMGNIVDGRLIDDGFKYLPADIDDLPKLYLKRNDILFNRTNSYELVGKSALYSGQNDCATFASYLIRIRLYEKRLQPKFFSLAMNAPYFRSTQIEPEIVQQCGQANFNGTKLSLCLVPLPPLNEQGRIVEKIDQLMALCDTLEQQINTATGKQTELLNAMMAQL